MIGDPLKRSLGLSHIPFQVRSFVYVYPALGNMATGRVQWRLDILTCRAGVSFEFSLVSPWSFSLIYHFESGNLLHIVRFISFVSDFLNGFIFLKYSIVIMLMPNLDY